MLRSQSPIVLAAGYLLFVNIQETANDNNGSSNDSTENISNHRGQNSDAQAGAEAARGKIEQTEGSSMSDAANNNTNETNVQRRH